MTAKADARAASATTARGEGEALWVARAREALAGHLPSAAARDLLAGSAGVLMYIAADSALFFYGAPLQRTLVVGIVVGLLARSLLSSVVAGACAGTLGVILMPPVAGGLGALFDPRAALGLVLFPAGVAACAGIAHEVLAAWVEKGSADKMVGAVSWALVGLVVADLWVTTFVVDSRSMGGTAPAFELLRRRPAAGVALSDDEFNLRVLDALRAGEPYYPAYARVHRENLTWGGRAPDSVFRVREPAIYRLWLALDTPERIVGAFLLLVTAAAVSAVRLVSSAVPPPLGAVSAAAVATYYLSVTTRPRLDATVWASTLLVVCAVLVAESHRSERWRQVTVSAVAIAVLAAVLRELAAYALLLGLAASALSSSPKRRFHLTAWAVGSTVAGLAYAAHFVAARPHLVRAAGAGEGISGWLRGGGPGNLARGLAYGMDYLGGRTGVAAGLILLGFVGILALRGSAVRLFVLGLAALPAVGFLVAGPSAVKWETGELINYWGVLVGPVLMACAPVSLSVLRPTAAGAEISRKPKSPKGAGERRKRRKR